MKTKDTIFWTSILAATALYCWIWYGIGRDRMLRQIATGEVLAKEVLITNFVYKAVSPMEKP